MFSKCKMNERNIQCFLYMASFTYLLSKPKSDFDLVLTQTKIAPFHTPFWVTLYEAIHSEDNSTPTFQCCGTFFGKRHNRVNEVEINEEKKIKRPSFFTISQQTVAKEYDHNMNSKLWGFGIVNFWKAP